MSRLVCPHCGALQKDDVVREDHCLHCGGLLNSPEAAPETETILPSPGVAEAVTLPPSPWNTCPYPTETDVSQIHVDPELANHPRYRVENLLGSGGMGTVYKAAHRLMKRTVALKVIKEELVANETNVERFHQEVEAAARLHHPNIVTAYDADQAGPLHLLVMEYVQGKDLHKLLAERGPLPIGEACAYVRQAALGLQHAMDNGMVHRDIKPQNLIVTAEGQVKILDFGLASLAQERVAADRVNPPQNAALPENAKNGRLTLAGVIMGTPDYMAPEQANDARSADIRADVYSLGCTLYYLLTGEVPFPGGTSLDKILAHAQRSPRLIRELRPDVPKRLARLLERMLAKDPALRPQTPAEVAETLGAIERSLVPCPLGIQVAAWLWIGWASLALCLGVGFAVYFQAHMEALLIPSLLLLWFIYKGVSLLRGWNATPGRDGIGSIVIGIGAGSICIIAFRFRQIFIASSPSVVFVPILVSCVLFCIVGILLVVQRRAYLSWVRGDNTREDKQRI